MLELMILPFVQLVMRVHARQDSISPQPHEIADDVTIISFYQIRLN